jgi:hypothetical protein
MSRRVIGILGKIFLSLRQYLPLSSTPLSASSRCPTVTIRDIFRQGDIVGCCIVDFPLFTLPVSPVPVLLGAIRIAISTKFVQLINRPLRAPSFDDDTHFCCIPFFTPRHRGRLIIRRELPRAWTSFVTDSASFTWQLYFGSTLGVKINKEDSRGRSLYTTRSAGCQWPNSSRVFAVRIIGLYQLHMYLQDRTHGNPMGYAVRKAESSAIRGYSRQRKQIAGHSCRALRSRCPLRSASVSTGSIDSNWIQRSARSFCSTRGPY